MNFTFQTADINLASYLYACSYPLLEIRFYRQRAVFQFPVEAVPSAEAFYEGASLPAKNLLYAARQLQYRARGEAE